MKFTRMHQTPDGMRYCVPVDACRCEETHGTNGGVCGKCGDAILTDDEKRLASMNSKYLSCALS